MNKKSYRLSLLLCLLTVSVSFCACSKDSSKQEESQPTKEVIKETKQVDSSSEATPEPEKPTHVPAPPTPEQPDQRSLCHLHP